jgi:flagellar motor switch protein FliG
MINHCKRCLRSVDTELLILALKGADEPLQEKLFSCMSKRAAANIMDEMEALGPVRLTEVQGSAKRNHQCCTALV